ncbi:MAG: hypothetical protein AB1758_22030 [Candidatus Eremiobacterota bacterium]
MDVLSSLYNACDPLRPATEAFYVDCTEVRGGGAFVRSCLRELDRSSTPLRFLFSGHVGTGKSSELARLNGALRGGKRFFPVLMDMGEYLDDYDVTATDILLAVVAELGEALSREGVKLTPGYFQSRWDEIKRALTVPAEISGLQWDLGLFKGAITPLRENPNAREVVRRNLVPQTTRILNEVNQIFGRPARMD